MWIIGTLKSLTSISSNIFSSSYLLGPILKGIGDSANNDSHCLSISSSEITISSMWASLSSSCCISFLLMAIYSSYSRTYNSAYCLILKNSILCSSLILLSSLGICESYTFKISSSSSCLLSSSSQFFWT